MRNLAQIARRNWPRWTLAVALAAQAVCLWAIVTGPRVPKALILPVAALGLVCIFVAYVTYSVIPPAIPKAAPPSQPAVNVPSASAAKEIRILLAEDSEDNQLLISTFLRQAGWKVALARTGAHALRMATSENFDLILMDMQMPEMDGYQATRELRRLRFTKPIVALTADTAPEARQQCLHAGCTEYLSKPVARARLLAACRSFLGEKAAAAPHPTPAEEPEPLRSTMAGDPRIRRVLDGFVSRLPQRVKQLADSATAGDLERLKQAVHNLKGAGAGYGFVPLSESAQRVEEALRAHKGLDEVRRQVDELIDLIRHIEGYDPRAEATAAPASQAVTAA